MDEYYGYQTGPTKRQMLARIIIGGIALFILIGLLIWFLFFRHPNADKVAEKTRSTESSQSGSDNQANGSDSPGSTTGTTSNSSGTGGGSSSSSTAKPSTNGTSSSISKADNSNSTSGNTTENLSKTGPGETLLIFAGAVVIGTLFRRLQLVRRSN